MKNAATLATLLSALSLTLATKKVAAASGRK